MTTSWRTWAPHRAPVAERRFVGAVRQIVGGLRWSLCLVTRMESNPAHRQDQSVGLAAREKAETAASVPAEGGRGLQRAVAVWHESRFPTSGPVLVGLKAAAELGELAEAIHSRTPDSPGVRGEVGSEAADVAIADHLATERVLLEALAWTLWHDTPKGADLVRHVEATAGELPAEARCILGSLGAEMDAADAEEGTSGSGRLGAGQHPLPVEDRAA